MKHRNYILSLIVYLLLALILARFFYWQIIKNQELKEKSLSQTYKLVKSSPKRGLILASDDYPMTLNENSYILSIYKPNLKTDLKSILAQIESVKPKFLQLNQDTIDYFQNKTEQKWIQFNTLFSVLEKNKLEKISGLEFTSQATRYYPEGTLAKNILGIIAKNDQGNYKGYGGLEGYYDKTLSGRTGFSWTIKNGLNQTILTKQGWKITEIDGENIKTSINRSLQNILEKKIEQGLTNYQADMAMATIMDSKTGQIIAMTNYSNNKTATASATDINQNISYLFEPGSVFKPIFMALSLDSHKINQNFNCPCNQPLTIGEYTINNWDEKLHPDSPLKDIIRYSDNIGMATISKNVDSNTLIKYSEILGLGKKSGIDLQGESRPIIKKNWGKIDIANASFGQGFAITQIQLIKMFNSLTYGKLTTPKIATNNSPDIDNIFTQSTRDNIKSYMKYAVESGNMNKYKNKDMEVCAKSGTAQIAYQGKYDENQTIASYIGFSPCDNPKFTMIITLVRPKTSPWAEGTAGPMWYDIANDIYRIIK